MSSHHKKVVEWHFLEKDKNIYRDYLIENGIKEEQIITIELDLAKDIKYRNPLILSSYEERMWKRAKTSIIFLLMKFKCLMR